MRAHAPAGFRTPILLPVHNPPSESSVVAVPGILLRTWDEETVAYNPRSGEVHLLNPAALAVLECLMLRPAAAEDLASRAAEALGIDADDEWRGHVRRLVRNLDELGLIVPAP